MLTSWGQFAVQSLSLFVLTPLVLYYFNDAEATLFLLFSGFTTLTFLLPRRVGLTFSRLISFADAGSDSLILEDQEKGEKLDSKPPNLDLMREIYSGMSICFFGITFLVTAVIFIVGYYSIANITLSESGGEILWQSFGVFLLGTFLRIYLFKYYSTLMGLNKVALVNRWDMLFFLLSLIVSLVVVLLGLNLVSLIVAQQSVLIGSGLRNCWLCRSQRNGLFRNIKGLKISKRVYDSAFPPMWRGLMSQLSTVGVIHSTGAVLTGFASVSVVSSYLLAVRLVTTIGVVSQVPVSSKQPYFSRLWASNDLPKLRESFEQRLKLSTWMLSILLVGLGCAFSFILRILNTDVQFVDLGSWFFLSFVFLLERFNTQHIILLESKNRIIFPYYSLFVGVVCVLTFALSSTSESFYFMFSSIWGVRLIMFNYLPIRFALEDAQINFIAHLRKTIFPVFLFHTAVCFLILSFWDRFIERFGC